MDGRGGGEADCLGGGGTFGARGSWVIFLVYFFAFFLKPILVRVPMV